MKKVLFYILWILAAVNVQAQESEKPLFGIKIQRQVESLIMQDLDTIYHNVTLILTSSSITKGNDSKGKNYRKPKVRVVIKDNNNSIIYFRKFKGSYLYIHSDGTINVGQPRFNQIDVRRYEDGAWYGAINKNEGIY